MNRYPIWKYVVIVIALLFGAIYTLPNYYGESPAVQVSSAMATVKVGNEMVAQVEKVLADGKIKHDGVFFEVNGSNGSVRARFFDTNAQFSAKNLLEKELNPDPNEHTYSITFNLLSNTPAILQKIGALPMYLGLDLRGGVHFLMQVDTRSAVEKRLKSLPAVIRANLKENNIYTSVSRDGDQFVINFKDEATRSKGKEIILSKIEDLNAVESKDGEVFRLTVSYRPAAIKKMMDEAVKQNITTLGKRVNELGVAEPLIQQQGLDRIVVQLPGVQDVARAKSIIGRTATLEVRMADDSVPQAMALTATIPSGSELFKVGRGAPVVLFKEAIITGDSISGASFGQDQNGGASVNVDLNAEGGRKMRKATADKIGKPMGIVLFEKNRGEVLTVATIQAELGSKFQITGMGNSDNAAELALLLRAGSLAAQMEIIEERVVGPQLGAENIKKGFDSTLYGFAAIAVFMIGYYMMFGLFSVSALALNVLLLIAILSRMQATLTLPGIAAIALALGMAIDSNVLINERIREELRAGNTPQGAIREGFDRAWDTILDSNVTTLIVGLALLIFGSGAVRGFAVVHVLGILTSMFSAVFFSRGLVNLWYGSRKKLATLSIGEVWKPAGQDKKSNELVKKD